MFLRLVSDSFTRRPRRKLLTGAALALGMAIATAALSVSLDVGDRLASEFRSLGANLVVTPVADSVPLEIGGVDYRPVNSGAYLPESDLPRIKTVFWHNNIIGFSPVLETRVEALILHAPGRTPIPDVPLVGTWAEHPVALPDGGTFLTGAPKTNPWWRVEGRWFADEASECLVGRRFAERNHVAPADSISLGSRVGKIPTPLVVTGILSSGGAEEDAIVAPLGQVQRLTETAGVYRKLYVSALTKPEDDFGRRSPAAMSASELERWMCTPYVSSIAYQIQQVLPGSDVRVIRRVAEGEGVVLTRVRALLWFVTAASLLAAALAVAASSAASVIERRTEIALMKALGAGSANIGFLLAAEQLLLAFAGGGIGYAIGVLLARFLGQRVFGVTPSPSLLVLAVVLVLAAGVTLAGSTLPLRRAARYEPAPILRGE